MNKKTIAYLLLLFLPMAFAAFGSSDISFSRITIDQYTADITLNSSGDMIVTERWDMDYPSAEYWVRFRDIDYLKYNADNPLYQSTANTALFDTTSVNVEIYKDGVELTRGTQYRVGYSWENDIDELGYYVDCDPVRGSCESIFTELYDHSLSDGAISFVYTYKIAGAVTRYSDISELNWILFEYAEGKIKSADVTVHFPANAHATDDIYVWGHSLASGTIDIVSNDEIDMHLDNVAKDDYIEFRILAPNDLFPNVAARNIVTHAGLDLAALIDYETALAETTNRRIAIAKVVFFASLAGIATMAFVTVYVYRKYDKEYTPRFQAEFLREPPGEETPAELSYLYYMMKINDETVTATLLDLIRRKYVEIDYQGQDMTAKNADFKLRLVKNANLSVLMPHEQKLIEWFFRHVGGGTEVTIEQIEHYPATVGNAERFQADAKQFLRLAKNAGEKHDYFEKSLSTAKKAAYAFALIPAVLLAVSLITAATFAIDNTVASIVSGLLLVLFLVYVGTIKKRSVNGNEEYVKWRAFRKFLTEFGRFQDYPMPSVIVWEHYLVYATVLKCADLVMEQLKVKLPLDDEMLSQSTYLGVGYRSRGFYMGYMFGRFHNSFVTARSVARQTIVAANSAKVGVGGHGGGFGGGRSFGGGGGGGRSR
jgi:uncharacterized membrane protein